MSNITLSKNHQLGDYKISKKISGGGFSIVYLGYTQDGAPVAIKEFFPNNLHLRPRGTNIEFINMREKHKFNEGLKAFRQEMEIVTKLKHKNIIEITNYFELNGTAYLVMPYEYGMTLSKYISSKDSLEEADVINIIKGVFSAIDLLHENNIVHLDLKPGNIWLRPNKEALILDFGTARVLTDEEKKKVPPMFTPGYAAPEQHRQFFKPENIGPWTDYYGLGTTLFALLEKRAPEPADELTNSGERITIVKNKTGSYSREILEIVEDLTQIQIADRRRLSLKEIIAKLNQIKPIKFRQDIALNSLFA